MSEDQIQAKCFQLAWNQYPETRYKLFHIPNGGFRNKREAAKFKAIGVISGVPDLCLIWKGLSHYIELKTPKGSISATQKKIHDEWSKEGIRVHVVRSIEQFEKILKSIIL